MKEIYNRKLETVTSKQPKPITCFEDDSLEKIVELLASNDIGSVIVVDFQNYPIGILTERDLILKVVGKGVDLAKAKVADFMTAKPQTLTLDKPISSALVRMRVGDFRHIAITDFEGKLVKVFSVKDALNYLSDEISDMMSDLLVP